MKSRLQLSETLLKELSRECSVDPTRDLYRLRDCVKHRGESFLTITLPDFCSGFERSLDVGRIGHNTFVGPFGDLDKAGKPGFLRGFLDRVFDEAGVLRRDVPPNVVYAVRQFCLLHKKSWAIASESRQLKAIKGYLRAEAEITESFNDPGNTFRITAAIVISDIVQCLRKTQELNDLIGRHGPGATAEGFTSNEKWSFSSWHERLEREFPYSRHAVSDESLMLEPEIQSRVNFVQENDEPPVKVVFVPKTMKTPRVIAIEPACMQYAQQAVATALIPIIEHRCELTSGQINFSDQTVNQRLALESSSNQRLATLDMKEASDRVSYAHAKTLFAVAPELWRLIDACRSRTAQLPDGTVVPLKKFASMGSAMCFPVEALAFFVAIVAARLRIAKLQPTRRRVREYGKDVYVYGDDLIVPVNEAESICGYLESFGFRVNSSKSFWTGKFRESCGVDAYDGTEVTPTYCRFAPPGRTDYEALVSWVAMANGFYSRGLWHTAKLVRGYIESILGELPVSSHEIGGLHWKTYSRSTSVGKWCSRTHSVKVRTWIPTAVRRNDPLESYAALHKCLQSMEARRREVGISHLSPVTVDRDHLLVTVRRHALALKRGWVLVG